LLNKDHLPPADELVFRAGISVKSLLVSDSSVDLVMLDAILVKPREWHNYAK